MFQIAIATEKLSFHCIYPLHSKTPTCANNISLLHTLINVSRGQMYIMFINLIIIKMKWVNKRSFFCQKKSH